MLCDDDAMSLPDYSDYEKPSWYPTQDSGSTSDHVFDATHTPPLPNTAPPSHEDLDLVAPPAKPSTRVFKANNQHDYPPPIPSTPPPSIPASALESSDPFDLPGTSPPEMTDDNLSDLLDFIPPPVLDPSFEFLVGTEDEVSVKAGFHSG
jgi:hypothetical protein